MNFLQISRVSALNVALNIMTSQLSMSPNKRKDVRFSAIVQLMQSLGIRSTWYIQISPLSEGIHRPKIFIQCNFAILPFLTFYEIRIQSELWKTSVSEVPACFFFGVLINICCTSFRRSSWSIHLPRSRDPWIAFHGFIWTRGTKKMSLYSLRCNHYVIR